MPAKIRRRGKNSFELSVSCGLDANGKQRVARKTVQCTERDVEREYAKFAAAVMNGQALVAGKKKMTLKEFYDYWKHHHCEPNNEATTVAYNDALFPRIDASLGHLKLDKILPRHILAFIDQLRAPDAGHGDRPLSTNTIRKHFVLLKTLFNTAIKWEYILTNPCSKVEPPRQEKPKKHILSEPEMAQFLSVLAAKATLKQRLWVFLSFTGGLRREEIFGLKWKDIDFDKRTVAVERAAVYVAGSGVILKDTKSDSGQRTVTLPMEVLSLLETYRQEVQAAAKKRAKRQKVVSISNPCDPDAWLFLKQTVL